MDELSAILSVAKAQAAAGTERIAFDPMTLAYAIETGVTARAAAERDGMRAQAARDAADARWTERRRIADWLDSDWPGDAAEERYHRAWIAEKLRLEA